MLNLMHGFVKQGIDIDLVLVKRKGHTYLRCRQGTDNNLGDQRLLLLPALVATCDGERPPVLLSVMEDTSIGLGRAGVTTRVVVNIQTAISPSLKYNSIEKAIDTPTSAGSTLGLSQLSQYPKVAEV